MCWYWSAKEGGEEGVSQRTGLKGLRTILGWCKRDRPMIVGYMGRKGLSQEGCIGDEMNLQWEKLLTAASTRWQGYSRSNWASHGS